MTTRKARNILVFLAVLMLATLTVNIATGVDALSAFTIAAASFTTGAWAHRWLSLLECDAEPDDPDEER